MERKCILVVDDEEKLRAAIRRILNVCGFTVFEAADAIEALDHDLDVVDLVVTDYSMPGRTGLELARDIKLTHPDLPIILYTANGTSDFSPADALLSKPVTSDVMIETINRLIAAR